MSALVFVLIIIFILQDKNVEEKKLICKFDYIQKVYDGDTVLSKQE
jgi:hypothetical protein